jgi:glycosyltransferase involved in cell wall biosynthesis
MVGSSLRRGGAEKQSVYIARALLESGIDVRFFYLGGGGHYESVLRELKVPVSQIYYPNRSWRILVKLILALRQWQPHVVLIFQFGDMHLGGIAGRFSKALILGGVQSDGWYELRYFGRLSRPLLRLAHGILPNSHGAKQTLASQGLNPQKMDVLANVLDLRDFDDRSRLPFSIPMPPDRVVAAAVGSLQPCKRFDRFLDAIALARRVEPTLAGVIAGGDLGAKAALLARADALGLGPQDVSFLGECHNVPALLARTAMLVLSSDYEGLPNVILEAMAARLPVITTPAGDAGLIVQHGRTGYVVEPDSIQGMAHSLIRLARSPATRTTFGEAGRQRVEQEYEYELLAERLLGIFHRFADQQQRIALRENVERILSARQTGTLSRAMLVERPAA